MVITMNLPKLFEDRMKTLLGDEYADFRESYSKTHHSGLRVNTLKTTPKEFEENCPFSIKRIPWIPNGYYYDSDLQVAKHPYYYAGLYYIQEPSAMTPASLLPIDKGDKVLDICAAPGGKSTELGAKLGGEGVLVTNDISNSRAKALLKNIELFGISNALIVSEAPDKLLNYFPEYFDKILIDAPCSGEGMFRKSPAMIKNWEEFGVEYYSKIQKEIIIQAAKMLKPGGMILYSTCTFSPEEDEGTIAYLLEEFPEFKVVNCIPDEVTQTRLGISYEGFDTGKPQWVNGPHELKNCIRLWPHKIDGEGHFMALLQKGDITDDKGTSAYIISNDKSKLSAEAKDFIDKINSKNINNDEIMVRGPWVHNLPKELPDTSGLRILRQGLLLGEMKKQRFEPSQALANALHIEDYDKIINFSVDDSRAIRYLKCETIELEDGYEDGWYLIAVEEFPLGWAKSANNKLKNKYIPEWRWL